MEVEKRTVSSRGACHVMLLLLELLARGAGDVGSLGGRAVGRLPLVGSSRPLLLILRV